MTEYSIAVLVVGILGGVWGIVTGATKVVKPLVEAITTLDLTVKKISEELKELKIGSTNAHNHLQEHDEKQDERLENHEQRINVLEYKQGVKV